MSSLVASASKAYALAEKASDMNVKSTLFMKAAEEYIAAAAEVHDKTLKLSLAHLSTVCIYNASNAKKFVIAIQNSGRDEQRKYHSHPFRVRSPNIAEISKVAEDVSQRIFAERLLHSSHQRRLGGLSQIPQMKDITSNAVIRDMLELESKLNEIGFVRNASSISRYSASSNAPFISPNSSAFATDTAPMGAVCNSYVDVANSGDKATYYEQTTCNAAGSAVAGSMGVGGAEATSVGERLASQLGESFMFLDPRTRNSADAAAAAAAAVAATKATSAFGRRAQPSQSSGGTSSNGMGSNSSKNPTVRKGGVCSDSRGGNSSSDYSSSNHDNSYHVQSGGLGGGGGAVEWNDRSLMLESRIENSSDFESDTGQNISRNSLREVDSSEDVSSRTESMPGQRRQQQQNQQRQESFDDELMMRSGYSVMRDHSVAAASSEAALLQRISNLEHEKASLQQHIQQLLDCGMPNEHVQHQIDAFKKEYNRRFSNVKLLLTAYSKKYSKTSSDSLIGLAGGDSLHSGGRCSRVDESATTPPSFISNGEGYMMTEGSARTKHQSVVGATPYPSSGLERNSVADNGTESGSGSGSGISSSSASSLPLSQIDQGVGSASNRQKQLEKMVKALVARLDKAKAENKQKDEALMRYKSALQHLKTTGSGDISSSGSRAPGAGPKTPDGLGSTGAGIGTSKSSNSSSSSSGGVSGGGVSLRKQAMMASPAARSTSKHHSTSTLEVLQRSASSSSSSSAAVRHPATQQTHAQAKAPAQTQLHRQKFPGSSSTGPAGPAGPGAT